MTELLTNGNNGDNCDDMKKKKTWITIRIDDDVSARLSARGAFGQSYNDVIAGLLNECDTMSKEVVTRKEKKE